MIVTIFRWRILWDKKYSVFNSPNSWLGIVAQVESLSSETSTLVHRSSRGWVSSYGDFNRSSNTIPQLSIHLSLSPPPIIFSPLFFPPPPTKNILFTHFSGSLTITINHLFSLISPPLLPNIFRLPFVFCTCNTFLRIIQYDSLWAQTRRYRPLGGTRPRLCTFVSVVSKVHLCTPLHTSNGFNGHGTDLDNPFGLRDTFFFFPPSKPFSWTIGTGSRTITKRWGSIVRIYYSGRICLIFLKRNFFLIEVNFWWILK